MNQQSSSSHHQRLRRINSKKEDLLRHASATLGSGSLREAVKLPPGEDCNEWIAMNIVDFAHQVSLMYGTVSEACTAESCPKMTAGPQFEFYWSDQSRMLAFPAPLYIDYTLSWVQDELDDENTFPSQIGKPFPQNFSQIAKTIVRRLFRIYAHVYYEHFDYIQQLKAVEHLNTSFKHFMLFVHEFRMLTMEEMAPLKDLIQELAPIRNNNGN